MGSHSLLQGICPTQGLNPGLLHCRKILYHLFIAGRLFTTNFSSVQLLNRVWLFATPWTVACQASLSLNISQSLPKFMFIALVMPSSHLILWHPLLLLPLFLPSIRDCSNEPSVCIRWPKYWSFSFTLRTSSEYSGLICVKIDWFDLLDQLFSLVDGKTIFLLITPFRPWFFFYSTSFFIPFKLFSA